MQSRLVLRRCTFATKQSHHPQPRQPRHHHDITTSHRSFHNCSKNKKNDSASSATTTTINSSRQRYKHVHVHGHVHGHGHSYNRIRQLHEIGHNHHRCRYVQTSSTSKSPAASASAAASASTSSAALETPTSSQSASLSSSSSSQSSSSLYDELINTNDDDVLKFTNAGIHQLLQNELLAIEKIESTLQNVSPFDNLSEKNDANDIHVNVNANINMNASSLEMDMGPMGIDQSMEHSIEMMEPLESIIQSVQTVQDEMKVDIKQALREQQKQLNNNQSSPTSPKTKPTMAQLLENFNPQSPPPPNASLHEVQQWLECSAQQESVQRYEAMIESTRERQDYTSLSLVQRHLLEWYNPLLQRILEEQEEYLSPNQSSKRKKGSHKYGPFLCTLQAEKIAILTTHEATMFVLQKGGDSTTLVTMALKIAEAVEAEVNVQRLLKQRMETNRKKSMKEKKDEADAITAAALEEMDEEELLLASKNENNNNDSSLNDEEITTLTKEEKESIKKKNEVKNKWMYGPSHLQRFVDEMNRSDPTRKGKVRIQRANRRAMKLLDSVEPWSTGDKVTLGVVLIQMLVDTAKIDLRGKNRRLSYDKNGDEINDNDGGTPAFVYEKKWYNQNLVGCVSMNEEFYKMVVEDKFSCLDAHTTRHKPMVVPPRAWTGHNDGGYTVLNTEFMRARGCQMQKDALKKADLSTVMDGLNVLGQVPWVINKNVLKVAEKCWDEGIVLGDIPSKIDLDLPPMPIRPDGDHADYQEAQGEFQTYREALIKHRRVHQKNMDLRSLRCSAILKLNQADQFKNFEKVYFPYNVDFRGRAYPVPPHLSNIGSDLCRGMLTFAESKPLGTRGFYWLKVHLANLAGNDKISFDERAEFTERNMDNVRDCVNDPFGANNWWMTLDDPFQAMATCHEIVAAIDSGSPETYESSLPVHMDGSCNGLQHYAALGRDSVGGKAVNLCPFDKPQDVYSGVMDEVIKRVAEEAERLLDIDESNPDNLTKNEKKALANHRAARLVNGLIDRGVVKRTVMTSVYGVTYIGAKKQIQEKIEEKLEAKGFDVDERSNEIYAACGYLATVTMDVMGDLFQGARQTMNWLATCANLISSQGQPVTWISPTGVPAVQPYRQKQPYTIVTLLQVVVLINNSDNLPIHKNRQTSAFPPNYIHSLDSAHMLLTAIEMDKLGLTFSAVHDSFWTHPCDIDEMNDVLRRSFIDLYEKPLLEELKETWELQYPSLEFPDLPERGDLDLNDVRKAPYFFQ